MMHEKGLRFEIVLAVWKKVKRSTVMKSAAVQCDDRRGQRECTRPSSECHFQRSQRKVLEVPRKLWH
eukprot:s668_g26.t1